MSRVHFARRDLRALLGGAAAITLLLGAARAVPVIAAWQRETRAEDIELRSALARSRALVARSADARDSTLARGRQVVALAPEVLGGDTPNAAGAALAGLLSGAAAVSSVRLGAVQLRNDTLSRAVFTRIGAHVEATGDVRGIAQMLAALERGPTLLAVRSLAISQPDLAAGDDRMEVLHMQLDVEGLMLNPRTAK